MFIINRVESRLHYQIVKEQNSTISQKYNLELNYYHKLVLLLILFCFYWSNCRLDAVFGRSSGEINDYVVRVEHYDNINCGVVVVVSVHLSLH